MAPQTQNFSDLIRRPASREKLKARIGLDGISGGGKSLSALMIAYGLCGDWGRITVIDAEERRGELHTGTVVNGLTIGKYNVVTLTKPFHPERYIYAMHMCEKAGDQVVIVDSISHAWEGTGGMLEQKDIIAKRGGNSYFAWREITPQHNELIDAILRSPAHVIVCCRVKTDYAHELTADGKIKPVKIGLKPIYRDGLEYEFLLFFDIDQEHYATASKDMTHIFGRTPFVPSPDTGRLILHWLETGVEPEHWRPIWEMIATNPYFVQQVNGVASFTSVWYDLLRSNQLPLEMQTWTYQDSLKVRQVIDWYTSQLTR